MKFVESKLDEFGLTMSDVYKVITDNGSNMIKAFSKYEGNFNNSL